MLTKTIRQIFPNSLIVDAALKFPVTPTGWEVDCPGPNECRFYEKDFYLVLNLQDMLCSPDGGDFPIELERIHATYNQPWADLSRIVVVVWPKNLAEAWNKLDSFHVVEFSTHQYSMWETYKQVEDGLREAFSVKTYEDNFLCMNRIDKIHRRALYGALQDCPGNISYQHLGVELKYPGFSFAEYQTHYDNLMNLLSLKKNFNTSALSVIGESQYKEKYGIVTEKTFNAIVAGHPFIVIGHKGILEDIKAYGFKTFDIFNEGYDSADDLNRAGYAVY